MLKSIFVGGILLGFAAVLSAAGLYPWVDHPRLISHTQVLPNGGRHETFLVRLPLDRIASLGSGNFATGAAAYPSDLTLPVALTRAPSQIDHFKLRDATGDVVGVASRHMLGLPDGTRIAWSITLPARGTLRLVSRTGQDAIGAALARIGYRPGTDWSGTLDVSLGEAQTRTGMIAGGSKEFAPLTGSYIERWQITGVDEQGNMQGTIELDTTSYIDQ